MQTMVILYLLGYLLELTATHVEEAYTAVKILYLGGSFAAPLVFFFICDYCNIKLHPVFVKAPMLLISAVMVLIMWTTKFHYLVYAEYRLEIRAVHRMVFTPGPLYPIINMYPSFCLLLTMGTLLFQIKKWKNRYRRQLFLVLLCVAIPFFVEGIYMLVTVMGLNTAHVFITPYSLAVMNICLYLGVMRLNIFEIISVATISAMDHIREGFVLVDEDNNYLFANPAALRLFPEMGKIAKGERILSMGDWPLELVDMQAGSVDFSLERDESRYFTASVSPVIARNQRLAAKIILLREITDSVVLMKELENAAYMDALTGLYNRKHFIKLANVDIGRAQRMNQSIYTAMLDLDFFKNVNDTYGHATGDMVLKLSAEVIRQTTRSYDLVGRYGGEEFILLITDLTASAAFKLMERIQENMERNTITLDNHKIRVTCSIGLARLLEGDTLEASINKADKALYTAKHSGRNQVAVYSDL